MSLSKKTLLKTRGYIQTPKTRNMHRKMWLGKNNPNWQGGTTELTLNLRACDKYKAWRKAIFQRDNYVCQTCHRKKEKLHPHHVRPMSEIVQEAIGLTKRENYYLRCYNYQPLWDVDNGQTLCASCHADLENDVKYGKTHRRNLILARSLVRVPSN